MRVAANARAILFIDPIRTKEVDSDDAPLYPR